MFDRASLKLGLDKAVLQSMSGRENSLGGGTGGGVSLRIVQIIWKKKWELNHLVAEIMFSWFSKAVTRQCLWWMSTISQAYLGRMWHLSVQLSPHQIIIIKLSRKFKEKIKTWCGTSNIEQRVHFIWHFLFCNTRYAFCYPCFALSFNLHIFNWFFAYFLSAL